MPILLLTNGMRVQIDAQDFKWAKKLKWSWAKSRAAIPKYYAARVVQRKTIYLHKEILECPSGETVDHKNGDTLDNRRRNLRSATRSRNLANRKPYGATSRFKGAYKRGDTWASQITVNRKLHYLGMFARQTDAAQAYDNAAKIHFGEFARLNFP